MSGIAYSTIMLGVLIPKLNIWISRGKYRNKDKEINNTCK